MNYCFRCRARPKQKHHNAKWCRLCAAELRRRPAGKLTLVQQRKVRRLAGTMYIKDLAKAVGTSDSNLDRWAKQNGVNINALKYPEALVREVCDYYAEHGRQKTIEHFPNVKVRSIVERYYELSPRQVRWTPEQIREAVQMAGLVSMSAQARYFDRPNANEGAITSLWMKRFGRGGAMINGLSWHLARRMVKPRYRPIRTAFWSTRHPLTNDPMSRQLALWTDLEKHLDSEQPQWIREAIRALARFQRWAHGVENVRPRIIRLIQQREVYGKRSRKAQRV